MVTSLVPEMPLIGYGFPFVVNVLHLLVDLGKT
jgi:hypothetical protein